MPFEAGSDYWIQIPGGRYRVGLEPAEAKRLASESAAFAKEQGVDLSLHGGRMMFAEETLLDTTGNPKWVEEYLLATFPVREVDLAPFAIARRPVTTEQFQQFMAETGEPEEPHSWRRSGANREAQRPVSGVPWVVATAFAEWAGARLPFEHEWERAARGPQRNVFPWGNDHAPLGVKILGECYPVVLPSSTTMTSEGIEGAVAGLEEWCADPWTEPDVNHAMWGEKPSPAWHRVLRGGSGSKAVVPNATWRSAGDPFAYWQEIAAIRLARGDGRTMPADDPAAPANERALIDVRTFETRLLGAALAKLQKSPVTRDHSIVTDWSGWFRPAPGARKVALALRNRAESVRAGLPVDGTLAHGLLVAAVSQETIRRVPDQHGVFLYSVMYRLESGVPRARPVTAFRMAFDKNIHRFQNRFRANEVDTRLTEVTVDMIANSFLEAFQYYEVHADSDESPFDRG